jgi:phage gpG-like protein
MNNSDKIKKQLEEVEKVIEKTLRQMGVEIKNFFINSFKKQGFTDEQFEKWDGRKDKKDEGRAILVKTGDLRRSIKVSEQTNDSVTISTDLPYAQYLNEGTKNMEKREFMGYSKALDSKIKKIIDENIKKIF